MRCSPLAVAAQHLFTSRQLELRLQMSTTPGQQMTQMTQTSQPALSDEGWDPSRSRRGWVAATASVGSAVDRLMRVKQVHGNVVRVLQRGDVAAANLERPEGDAIVANEPGLVLAVMVADCVPILIADAKRGAAAAVHAGWRGTCARVAPTAVACMTREFGTHPDDLIAAIGPSIGPADYEVGESLVEPFLRAGHAPGDVARWFTRRLSRLHLDLWSANRDQLIQAGLRPEQVFTCGLSTLAHPGLFDSYRAEGERAGRMAALIVVPDGSIERLPRT